MQCCSTYSKNNIRELDADQTQKEGRGSPHAVDKGKEAIPVVAVRGVHEACRELDYGVFRQILLLLFLLCEEELP